MTSPPRCPRPPAGRSPNTDVPVEQYQQILVGAGVPEAAAAVFADGDRGLAEGELLVEGSDLEKLIGRTPTSLADALAAAVARA